MSPNVQSILVGIGAIVTIIAAVFTAVRSGGRKAKRLETFLEDWYGEPARPGVAARPGVMERLATNETNVAEIKRELTTNGGSSLKDKVISVDGRLAEVEKKVGTPVTVNVNPGGPPPTPAPSP